MSNAHLKVECKWVRYPPVPCRTPLGLPVVPEVYRMKRGCVLSNSSGLHSLEESFIKSCQSLSFELIVIGIFVLSRTITFFTQSSFFIASSTTSLSFTTFPRL